MRRGGGRGWREALDDWCAPVPSRRTAVGFADRRASRAPIGRLLARQHQRGRRAARHRHRASAGSSSPTPRSSRSSRSSISSPRTTDRTLQSMYRIDGGNDRLAAALAAPLGDRLHLNTEVVAVSHRGQNVRVSVKNGRAVSQIDCDYAVFALPATTLRRIPFMPSLPAQQHDAIANLKYGRATKTLLQFSKRFWRIAGAAARLRIAAARSARSGTATRSNAARRAFSSLLAGGGASDATQAIVAKEGAAGTGARARVARGERRGARRVASDRVGAGTVVARRLRVFRPRRSTRRCARGSRARAGGCSSPASTPASSGRAT